MLVQRALLPCLSAAVLAALLLRLRRHKRSGGEPLQSPGLARATVHALTLPATPGCPELRLELTVAAPPERAANTHAPPLLLYVLDPEPLLYATAALFAYTQAAYYPTATEHAGPEATFRRLYVVGVGHARREWGADGGGFEAAALRQLRRRWLPPFDHPSIQPGRAPNACAARLAAALGANVAPHVERRLLGLPAGAVVPSQRALLGASYSSVLALQTLLVEGASTPAFGHLILGSPSVPFDPEILEQLATAPQSLSGTSGGPEGAAGGAEGRGVGALIVVGALERFQGPQYMGNVHQGIPAAAEELARVLAARGVAVDAPLELAGEDHTTIKLPLISQGLMWLARRVRLVEGAHAM